MNKQVDDGPVIKQTNFLISETETVSSLTEKCYTHLYDLFVEIMQIIKNKQPLPISSLDWNREPYTRKGLDELCEIRSNMSLDEVARRIRATTYPGMPGPFVRMGVD